MLIITFLLMFNLCFAFGNAKKQTLKVSTVFPQEYYRLVAHCRYE